MSADDRRASRRVGGSGDPDDGPQDDESRDDGRSSRRVGGSGDPDDEPVDDRTDRGDRRASERVGGSGDASDGPDGDDDLGGTAPRSGGDDDDPSGGGGGPLSDVVDGVTGTVDDVTTGVSDAVSDVTTGVGDTVSDVGSRIDDITTGVSGRVDDVTAGVGGTIDDVGAGVSDTVDDVSDTVDDVTAGVGDTVSDVGDDVTSGASDAADDVEDTVSDVSAGVSGVVGEVGSTVDDVGAEIVDRGQTVVERRRADINTDITDDLTTGGFLSEDAGDDSGLLGGSYEGVTPEGEASVDVSEAAFRERADAIDQSATEAFESNPELTVFGSNAPDRVITGAANAAVGVANVPGLVLGAETATEAATSAPGAVREEGARDVAETVLGVGAVVGGATAARAGENPLEFAGGAAFNLIGGAGAGRQLGRAGRSVRDRVRTAGGTEVDARDIASEDVVRFAETDGAEGTRFPGARDPDLYQTDPAAAVRDQAEEFTPDVLGNVFDEAEVEGVTLTKALDVEPEGPGRGRADVGFQSAPGETLEDFDYEVPGSFFGPELSPNFLGVDDGAGFSLRPGLPDTGNNPTAVFARTEVEASDADDLAGFSRELLDRRGETTARTKPPSEVNPGEAEAVVPPGAEFRPVGGGGALGETGSRAGVGSEFYTTIGGRRVPLRTVAPDDAEASQRVGGSGAASSRSARSLDDISERVETPTDRPLAGFGAGPSTSRPPSESSAGTDPFSFGGGAASGSDTSPGGSSGSPPPGSSGSASGGGSDGGSSGAPSGSDSTSAPVSSVDDLLGGSVSVGSPTTRVSSPPTTSPPTTSTSVSEPTREVSRPPSSTRPPSRTSPPPTSGGSGLGSGSSTIDRPTSRAPPTTGGPPTSGGGSTTGGGPPTETPTGPPDLPGEADGDRDPVGFGLEADDDEFSSGILSGEEAVSGALGRRPDDDRDPFAFRF